MKRIVVIDGHPDARRERFLHALANSYVEGAKAGGHEVWTINVAALDFPLLRTQGGVAQRTTAGRAC